jgi:hypothetical protein
MSKYEGVRIRKKDEQYGVPADTFRTGRPDRQHGPASTTDLIYCGLVWWLSL